MTDDVRNSASAGHDLERRWGPKEQWSIPVALRNRASATPDAEFLSFGDGTPETFAQTLETSEEFARRLVGLGVARGDRVAILASNLLDHVHLWLGIGLAGAAEVPLNTAYRGHTLLHGLNLSGAKVVVTETAYLTRIAEVEHDLTSLETVVTFDPPPATTPFERLALREFSDLAASDAALPDDITCRDLAAVVLTSGTTGPSKGVLMPQGQVFVMGRQTADEHRLTPDDIVYFCHTLFHSTKFMSVIAAITSGCRVVVDRAFVPADWVRRVQATRATYTIAHGPMIDLVCAEPRLDANQRTALRVVISGASTPHLQERFLERFGVEITEGFGMTEIGAVTQTPSMAENPRGSCGRAWPHLYEVRVADPETDEPVAYGELGELQVRPRHSWIVMTGYLGMPERTVEAWRNLWFHTGDLVTQDSDGFLYYVTRASERIRRRAENISAYDIELVASQFPGIRECAAVGVDSEFASSFDDDIMLAVVLSDEVCEIDMSELLTFLVGRLPHYMVPRYVKVLPDLPRTPTAKIQKVQIRKGGAADAWDRVAAGVSVREISEQLQLDR